MSAISPATQKAIIKKLEELKELTGLVPALLLFDPAQNSFGVCLDDALDYDDLMSALHSLRSEGPLTLGKDRGTLQ